MKKIKRINIIFLIIILSISLIACKTEEKTETPDKTQEQNKQDTAKHPAIPEAISQGEGVEPKLVVHIAEEGRNQEMAFEEYLQGVLAGEMKNDWPEEALKAQAILARTFVMEFVSSGKESKYEGAHISTDIEEAQAWNSEGINDAIKKAVNDTRGQVVLHNNEYIKAWFHAHAGGQTANAVEGLGFDEENPAYIEPVSSPDSEEAPEDDSNWTAEFTKAEIIQAVKSSGQEISDFDSIEISEKGDSGRAYKLKIGDVEVLAPPFRIALDSTKLKSTQITDITIEGDIVKISGVGYGHGVGMRQWGAYQMAEEGKTAEDIILHYFKDVEIVQLWQ